MQPLDKLFTLHTWWYAEPEKEWSAVMSGCELIHLQAVLGEGRERTALDVVTSPPCKTKDPHINHKFSLGRIYLILCI